MLFLQVLPFKGILCEEICPPLPAPLLHKMGVIISFQKRKTKCQVQYRYQRAFWLVGNPVAQCINT